MLEKQNSRPRPVLNDLVAALSFSHCLPAIVQLQERHVFAESLLVSNRHWTTRRASSAPPTRRLEAVRSPVGPASDPLHQEPSNVLGAIRSVIRVYGKEQPYQYTSRSLGERLLLPSRPEQYFPRKSVTNQSSSPRKNRILSKMVLCLLDAMLM